MIKINKKLLVILLVVALLLGAGGVLTLADFGVGGVKLVTSADETETEEIAGKYKKMDDLLRYIEDNYYMYVSEDTLLEGAYKGLFEALDDPYSQYVSAPDSDAFYGQILGTFYGIGLTFTENEEGKMEVVSTQINTPADKAKIKAGEIILAVDDVPTEGHTSNEVRDMIRGEKGTTVKLTLLRPDGESYSVDLQRDLIHDTTVEFAMMEDNIGYIRISSFSENTDDEFKTALTEIEKNNAAGFIIDLRYNGGGLVNVAVGIADELMNAGTVVFAVDGNGIRSSYTTKQGRTKLPYVVLVNEYSASASEILAAGIQDNEEGLIVGTQTYGKGIIQETATLSDGSIVKLTILQYFSPSGKAIHKVGITPDYVVELPADAEDDYQYNKAVELLLNNREEALPEVDIEGEGIARR